MSKKRLLLISIVLLVIILFAAYSIYLMAKPRPIEIQGMVDATEIKIASKLTGRIDSIFVGKGDDVSAGELLFTIKSPEVEAKLSQASAVQEAAQAQKNKAYQGAQVEDIQAAFNMWQKAKAASDFMQKTFTRVKNLYADGVVAAQKYDEAETQMKAADETEKAARAVYDKALNGARIEDKQAAGALLKQADGVVQEVTAYMNETRTNAPCKGEVAVVLAEPGEIVPAGYPVVTLLNMDAVWITFNLREDLLADIKKGDKLMARFPALKMKSIELEIFYIRALGDYATWSATKSSGDFDLRTFEVQARPVSTVIGLRPGMSALVDWNTVKTSK